VEEMKHAYGVLVGETQGKRPVGRSRHRWDGNIKLSLKEIRWDCMDCYVLAWDRDKQRALVNTVLNIDFCKIPQNFLG
jgi:hypothetical protein